MVEVIGSNVFNGHPFRKNVSEEEEGNWRKDEAKHEDELRAFTRDYVRQILSKANELQSQIQSKSNQINDSQRSILIHDAAIQINRRFQLSNRYDTDTDYSVQSNESQIQNEWNVTREFTTKQPKSARLMENSTMIIDNPAENVDSDLERYNDRENCNQVNVDTMNRGSQQTVGRFEQSQSSNNNSNDKQQQGRRNTFTRRMNLQALVSCLSASCFSTCLPHSLVEHLSPETRRRSSQSQYGL